MTDAALGLTLPLAGVQLVEASAGTGKTFTLATLYSRLVIEARLPVASLLAVTYTEAAAKELREALRARLARAAALLEVADAAALAPRAGEVGADALTGSLLRGALAAGETLAALRQRVRAAAAQMDLAPIHTIHGFCQRVLHEHALEAGMALGSRTLVPNEAELRREVATEYWRQHAADAEAVAHLLEFWQSPAALADNLADLLAFDVLLPARAPVDEAAARNALAAAVVAHGEAAHAQLQAAFEQRRISATIAKPAILDPVFVALHRWASAPGDSHPPVASLSDYGARALARHAIYKSAPLQGPLHDAIDAVVEARRGAAANRLHDVVDFARRRLAELKRDRALAGFDDLVGDVARALEGPAGPGLADALRRRFRVAMVDEFQDTDPRQWGIFRTLFATRGGGDGAGGRALFLIGDPKQAIYRFRGGDIATYLAAQDDVEQRHALRTNHRSRPRVVAAVAALFELRGPGAFRTKGIEFEPVDAAGGWHDAHFQWRGQPAAGVYVQPPGVAASISIDAVRARQAAHCVAAIHGLLHDAQRGEATIAAPDADGVLAMRAVQPGDITVLVGRNADAMRMQQALSAAGIPSVAAGRSSLFATAEARDIRLYLSALAAPADEGRLRALLATPLFGLDAADIARLDTDLAWHRHWQDAQQAWLALALRRGAMAALAGACATASARLLAQPGGERRLGNYLQLAEELLATEPRANGLPGVLAELEARIEGADERNDAELLRLESDARRVRIMTIYVSKGLTLDLVFVPFACVRPGKGRQVQPAIARVDRGLARTGTLVAGEDDPACAEEARELFAEQLRVLYVALTRARHATWVGWGLCKEALKSPIGWLLHRDAQGEAPGKLTQPLVDQALAGWQARAPGAITVLPAAEPPPPHALPRLRFAEGVALPPARAVHRALDRDWWVYSFSQLAREDDGALPGGAEDEAEPVHAAPSRLSGTRFGNALHTAFERIDFPAWRDWRGALPPPGQLEPMQAGLREQGFTSDDDQAQGVALLTHLVAETLNVALPEGVRLADVPPAAQAVEMEFHLALAPVAVPALLDVLHAHGILPARRGFGLLPRLDGLLTGRMDLVYEVDGACYVLDYKSNQLPEYGREAMARAVQASEYDLQYVLYTLALHRWLRFRLGDGYDMPRHLGGVRYLFCRGLDRDDPAMPGIHALRLPDALVLALDALFTPLAAA